MASDNEPRDILDGIDVNVNPTCWSAELWATQPRSTRVAVWIAALRGQRCVMCGFGQHIDGTCLCK